MKIRNKMSQLQSKKLIFCEEYENTPDTKKSKRYDLLTKIKQIRQEQSKLEDLWFNGVENV
jgi:hypothetical protein